MVPSQVGFVVSLVNGTVRWNQIALFKPYPTASAGAAWNQLPTHFLLAPSVSPCSTGGDYALMVSTMLVQAELIRESQPPSQSPWCLQTYLRLCALYL